MNNPLLEPFKTDFESTPFSEINIEHFIPALETIIKSAIHEIEKISNQNEVPTFSNTIEAVESCGFLVERNTSLLFNLNSAKTSESIQRVTQEAAPLLTKFQNDIRLNDNLFYRIRYVYQNEVREKLNTEQITLLEKEYKSFVRNGALLNKNDKEKLRNLDTQLAKLSLTFGENVLADSQSYELQIDDESKLKGLPPAIIEMAKSLAKQKGKKGWIFTLDYPSYVPFITYAEDRELRKEICLAYGERGFKENSNNNTKIILNIVKLRQERAELLGYNSHADFVLEERMAASVTNVKEFLDDLSKKALPIAQKEWKKMSDFAEKDLDILKLEKWDTAFVAEKLKKNELKLNEQELKPYFPLDSVLNGLFKIVGLLYEIEFKETKTLEVYHEEVRVFEVYRKEKFYALLYTDFYPRIGKRSGAWMTSYRSQSKDQRPHISIVCNFPKPTEKQPSLLTFHEVTTLFHEFGHAIHGILANTNYSSLSGTNVFWDFVELPSQIMENWCYQEEAIKIFSRHYKTNKSLPKKYIDKIKNASYFQQGLQTIRQLSFGYLDLSYHNGDVSKIVNIKEHEKNQIKNLQFTNDNPQNCMSTAFSHIFQGGYAAGYYSYKWAEVLDADAFELFLEEGVFNKKIANKFLKNILSKGGTDHPMKLYKKFRGKTPDPSALLRRAGIV